MRHTPNLRIEHFRRRHPVLGWSEPGENWGFFVTQFRGNILCVIASDGRGDNDGGWEHVSVSAVGRCPTWDEMAYVKGLFWADDETVLQFHPKKACYVNYMPHCLHLWKRVGVDYELPPEILIGPKQQEVTADSERPSETR